MNIDIINMIANINAHCIAIYQTSKIEGDITEIVELYTEEEIKRFMKTFIKAFFALSNYAVHMHPNEYSKSLKEIEVLINNSDSDKLDEMLHNSITSLLKFNINAVNENG